MGIVIRNSFKTSIVNYIGIIIGAFSVLFVQTKVLSEDQIGEIRLIIDKSILIMPFIVIGMGSIATRFYFHFDKDEKSHNSFITMLIIFPLILFFLLFSFFYFFNFYFQISHFILIATMLFTYVYLSIFEAYLTIKAKIIFPAIVRNIGVKVLYLVVLTFYYYEYITFRYVMVLFAVLHILHLILISYYFKKHLSFNFKFDFSFRHHPMFREIVVFSLFMIMGTGSGVLVTKLDTVMLEGITKDNGFVGVYTIALSLAAFIEMPRRPLSQMVVPILAKDLANNEIDKVDVIYKKSAINLMLIGVVLFSLIWINIDFIFSLMYNSEVFKTGKYVVFFLGMAKLLDLALGVNGEIIQNSKYYKWNLILMPFLAIISIGSNYYFISKYQSATGAAIATFISILLYNSIRTILVKVKLGLQPFSKKYFIIIPFALIPFVIDYYFLSIDINKWIKMFIDSSLIVIFFCLPVYFLKISPDINNMVNTVLRKYLNLKV